MYLIFNQNLSGYSSLIKSMQSALEIMIGKFSATQYLASNSILGPIITACYNTVILFFCLNIFISIIISSFEQVRLEAKRNPDEFGFLNHIVAKVKRMFQKKTKFDSLPSHNEYKDHLRLLPDRIDQIINFSIRVRIWFVLFDLLSPNCLII